MATNYTITNANYIEITPHLTNDLGEVATSMFTKYFSTNQGFGINLRTTIAYSQIRFYCYATNPGRTMHIQFLSHPNIYNGVFNFFTNRLANAQQYIHYTELYPDDNSLVGKLRSEWGAMSYPHDCSCGGSCRTTCYGAQYHQGVFGNTNQAIEAIYKDAIYKSGVAAWYIGFENSGKCDSLGSGLDGIFNGTWKIYVR